MLEGLIKDAIVLLMLQIAPEQQDYTSFPAAALTLNNPIRQLDGENSSFLNSFL